MLFTKEELQIISEWFGYRTTLTTDQIAGAVREIDDRGGNGRYVLGAAINHLLHRRGRVHK